MTNWEVWVSTIEDPESTIIKRIRAHDLEHLEQIIEAISPCLRVVAALKEVQCSPLTSFDSSAEDPCPPTWTCSERLTVCRTEQ